jgi:hypothetical protein
LTGRLELYRIRAFGRPVRLDLAYQEFQTDAEWTPIRGVEALCAALVGEEGEA